MISQKTKAVAITILAGILWGTSFPVIKLGLSTINPFTFVFWRFLVASVFLVAVMFAFKKLTFTFPDKKLLIFLGILNAAGYLLQYVSMNYTSVAKAALFINLSAMWVALLSPKILGETFSRKKIAGVLIGVTGVVFVSTNLDFGSMGQGQTIADIALIVSGLMWALFMIYNKKVDLTSTAATFQSMTWVLVLTWIAIVPFSVFAGNQFFVVSGWGWAAIFYTAIVCWVLPYYLWLEGLKHLSASTSTVLLLSEIVVALIASIVILKEPVTVFSTLGAFLIVMAIALVSVNDKKKNSLKK